MKKNKAVTFRTTLIAGVLAMTPAIALAQDYPDRPITLVVAFSPGGSSDTLARVLTGGDELASILGQPVVVENRPGASGYIAWRSVAEAEPDGYTVLLAENAVAINRALRPDEPLDPREAFEAVAKIGTAPLAVNVNAKLPIGSMEELIEYSKANDINFGSSGVGSVSHLSFEAVAAATGVKAQHIPFKGGGELRAALLGGHTQTSMSSIGGSAQMAADGGTKVVAVASPERVSAFPDAPTLTELGYKSDVEIGFWWGLFVPAGTPEPIKEKLENAFSELLQNPEVVQRMEGAEVTSAFAPADEMASLLDREVTNWTQFVKDRGITVE